MTALASKKLRRSPRQPCSPATSTRSEIGALAFEHQLTSNPLVLWEMYACARAAGVELPSEVVRYFDKVAARLGAQRQPERWQHFVAESLQMLQRPPGGGKLVARSPFGRRVAFKKLERGYDGFLRLQSGDARLKPLPLSKVLQRAAAKAAVSEDDLAHYLRERAAGKPLTQRKTGRPK